MRRSAVSRLRQDKRAPPVKRSAAIGSARPALRTVRVRVLDAVVAPDGRNAVVLVVLNADTPDPVLMISSCLYDDGRWEELVMTEGGDAGTNWLGDRCVAYASGQAPEGATAVVAEHLGMTGRRPIADGGLCFGAPGGDESELVDSPAIRFL